ncbi:hypothetical protein D3874_26330 [Oleomonas cavernae]|uniref:Lipoprotein n=1 Tax=Oleomonas cavernae TaxID=2320859 RepID=A0A418VTZ2_9PROT|nr:hypothetical protein [Oleomonas cavernae]RJF80628.1 hypothetical protein D3874_26330 [Oleomonas cavernae]
MHRFAQVLVLGCLLAGCVGGGGLERGGAFDSVPTEVRRGAGDKATVARCLRDEIAERDCNSSIQDALILEDRAAGTLMVMCDLTKHYRGTGAQSRGEYPIYTLTVRQVGTGLVEIENWAANQIFLKEGNLATMAAAVGSCLGSAQ